MVVKWYVARLLIAPLNKIFCIRKPQPHLSSSLKSLSDRHPDGNRKDWSSRRR